MSYLYSFIVGGTTVSLVAYLSRNGLFAASGIVMTVPVITIVSLLLSPSDISYKLAAFGIVGVLALLVFLSVYLAGGVIFGPDAKYISLTTAFLAWCIVVIAVLMLFPHIVKG